MLAIYPAVFHKENGYWVEFPDLQGCQTSGSTLEETMLLAQEALGLYIVSLEESKQTLPQSSDIDTITAPQGAFKTLVTCVVDNYRRNTKPVKKTLSIPEWLNEEAEKQHLNFSSILKEALIERIQK